MYFFVRTKEQALYGLKLYTNMLFGFTLFQLIIGILFRPEALIDVGINLIALFFTRIKHSRAAATILVIQSSISILATSLAYMGYLTEETQNIIFAMASFIISLRILEAAVVLNREKDKGPSSDDDFITKNRYKPRTRL